MLFNSVDFALFLPIVFILYWFVTQRNLKLQNILIVFASYFFYGWWDWRFLFLILFSSLIDYFIGIRLNQEENLIKRKVLLWTSICINLGFLGFFKYYNFFVDNFVQAFSFFGNPIQANTLDIILPVGISFYTFQTLSYTIDVYKRQLTPTKDFVSFMAFVSFFPQLVAGPIERATNLLPQFYKKRTFYYDNAMRGVRQIIWGLFKKVVIADTCAQYVNAIFYQYESFSSLTLFIGTICFAFQIYGDFSGYSDIAIGTSRLFGFELNVNFRYPYFSKDIGEFWRRWHISLSTWFRDYLYIPLGGSRSTTGVKIRNTFIIFLVSGLWHGANWTFIAWGGVNALLFLPVHLKNSTVEKAQNKIADLIKIGYTFVAICLTWVFFRAQDMSEAIGYFSGLFEGTFKPDRLNIERFPFESLPLIVLLIIIEWRHRDQEFPLLNDHKLQLKTIFILLLLLLFGSYSEMSDFIYFQF